MIRTLIGRFGMYFIVQLAAYGVDMGSYILLLQGGTALWLAVIIARMLAGGFAFILHKHVTFGARGSGQTRREIAVYFTLLIAMALVSAPLVVWLSGMLNKYLSKIIADTITIFIGFTLTRCLVFPVGNKRSAG